MRIRLAFLSLLALGGLLTGFHAEDPTIPPGTYTLDTSHSEVSFKVKHLGISTVTGYFRDYEATVASETGRLQDLQVRAVIQAASIDTGNAKRDAHLRSEDFFEAETYPTITFVSTGIRNVDEDEFEVLGNLTMHGVTRPVVLEAELVGQGVDPWGGRRVAFEGEAEIARKDFGLSWNKALETGGVLVGEDVRIEIAAEAVLQQ